ncbi:hypothetical protein SPONN_2274 [uncultured Candidatus Thioglobus sp.]|nr:hypothetical protein SPONN_2274 [uncultured Candidatus Thioglobus sp.]
MSKINLLSILIATSLLTACGFHTPKNTSLNVSVAANPDNVLAAEFGEYLNLDAEKKLLVQISDEVRQQKTIAYRADGEASSYTLSLNVPVKVLHNKKILFSRELKASMVINDLSLQANRLQQDEYYVQLRKTVIKKLLRILKRLNES